jgi:hypothetical protein
MEKLSQTRTEKRFKEIFDNKENVGSIGEKAHRNFEIKKKNSVSQKERVYHFCIGHAFKNVDKNIFEYELDEKEEQKRPTKFLSLQRENFVDIDSLYTLVSNIRNLNSHYVHTFDCIKTSEIDSTITDFLKEAFEFASVMIYLEENKTTYADYAKDADGKKKLQKSLCDKFFSSKEHTKEEREHFLQIRFHEAIESLLFINVKEAMEWKIQAHKVFDIQPGKYLSFHACLFILALFLYKDEAGTLISKIKGFKRNDDTFHYKRDIFTFFSKKFTSQDIDSEEKALIKFRDIIQDLNKYPTTWNKYLEPEKQNPAMSDVLEKCIIETEIFRSFPTYASDEAKRNAFLLFAVQQLFEDKKRLFDFENFSLSKEEEQTFRYELDTSKELKDIDEKLNLLKSKKYLSDRDSREKAKLEKNKKNIERENKPNPIKEKLQERIEKETLLKSYGRNQDRFMEMAARFLAEKNYFGKDAAFKLYQFYTTDEQNVFLEDARKTRTKKEVDKLKYHQGKLVHFSTYQEHLKRHPEWDMPFVVENNAIQIKIAIKGEEKPKLFSIQRNLMLYLLEDALFTTSVNIENAGKTLLEGYFNHLQKDFEAAKETVSSSHSISAEQKTEFKKLLPKRLLYSYHPAQKGDTPAINPFEKILSEAENQEKRYAQLLGKAQKLGTQEDFLKKNKGKQFKLRFVRKAWQLMFFKNIYLQQKEQSKNEHHKSFNISKEDFNKFSRWMYAFDEVPQYKERLKKLFAAKNFFQDTDFEKLFRSGTSLDDWYNKTKGKFSEWAENQSIEETKTGKYGLENYETILNKEIVYINISHFISYLESQQKITRDANGVIQYKALDNIKHLISEYYYKEQLPKEEYKENGKLYNKLKTNKLEDALLYELAMKYLALDASIIEKARTSVSTILNSTIPFDIKDETDKKKDETGKHLYNLIVPFNKIESLAVLKEHKKDQENEEEKQGRKKTSFLTNLYTYLQLTNTPKDIKSIKASFDKEKTLQFHELHTFDKHIISGSIKFTRIAMALEKYYIWKNKTTIKKDDNRIEFKEINGLKKLFNKLTRDKAFHFGIPEKEYETTIAEIETKFIKQENTQPKNSFKELPKELQAVYRVFMKILHNDLYPKKDRYGQKKKEDYKEDFENRYFDTYLKKKA